MARAGRRPGQTETRERILGAARAKFAEQGYDGATVRSIATAAGVNPALVHHFYGSKQQLFVSAMNLPFNPATVLPEILHGPPDAAGRRLVRMFLRLWESPDVRSPLLALLRSATTNERAVTMLRQFLTSAVLSEVATRLGVPPLQASAAAAQMVGIALLRYVIEIPPLVSASEDEIVDLVAPVIQHYLEYEPRPD